MSDLTLDRTFMAFRRFANTTQKQARANITRKNLKASGKLRSSLKFYVQRNKNSIQLIYERPEYADYQDRGVSGKEKKYQTPFKYTTKKPPAKVFEKWARQKGIKPRDQNTGRFISFKSFGFLVSRSIFKYGIKPKEFFSKPYRQQTQNLPEPILDAFNLDLDSFLKDTFDVRD